ncbi:MULTISPECIES: IS110 family transposase [Coprococcus]|uniref:IS110 family transposase n=1 Tax=Coprococcus TaxID=33042 RepID=UPI001FA9993E|nr:MULTISPECIES: IS110 family transposase [Coprococcus]
MLAYAGLDPSVYQSGNFQANLLISGSPQYFCTAACFVNPAPTHVRLGVSIQTHLIISWINLYNL